jgi:thiol:disulfide interchange protein
VRAAHCAAVSGLHERHQLARDARYKSRASSNRNRCDILCDGAVDDLFVAWLHSLYIRCVLLAEPSTLRSNAGDRGGSAFGAYVLGLAFAFGWTPCIGPQLGAILSLAASEADVLRGTMLLGIYALGLGIPFLLAAFFIDRAMGVMNLFKRHMGLIEKISGVLLILVGLAMITGAFSLFAFWLLETFPALGLIG